MDDCSETEMYRPTEIFKQLTEDYNSTCTSQWKGVYGTDQFPSIGQWEKLLNECNAFIFYGMEKFIAQVYSFDRNFWFNTVFKVLSISTSLYYK